MGKFARIVDNIIYAFEILNAAIVEGRGQAICEVGIAAMSVTEPCLVLCQISDVHSYINTLTKINIYNPCEVSYYFFKKRKFNSNLSTIYVTTQFSCFSL